MPTEYWSPGLSVIPTELLGSSLDLLTLPFALSQTQLLDPDRFVKEASLRGVRLDREVLELLHQRRVIVPMFRIHSRPMDGGAPVAYERTRRSDGPAWPVFRAANLGQLTDPGLRPFSPWPRTRHSTGVYYSRYQLMSLAALPGVMANLSRTRVDRTSTWHLPKLKRLHRIAFEQDRALAVVLEAVSARFLPRIMQSVSSPTDEMYRFLRSDDSLEERKFLHFVPYELLTRQADLLLSRAHTSDPLGKWSRVVRIADPARWMDLRNDALLAQEARVAAELILQFVESEAEHGHTDPLPPLGTQWWQPRHERITVAAKERSETIMDFKLSDRPALYLALEGATEVHLVRRLLELAGHERFSTWIDVLDLNGVRADVSLVARAVATPQVDPDGYVGARVTAPLTALVVATDPEDKHATESARHLSRERMIRSVLQALPPEVQTPAMTSELEHLIHVRSWPAEFEFAHFTDHALATALRRAVPDAPPLVELKRHLASCRANGGTIKNIWSRWKHQPSKVELAELLWPDLLRRVQNPNYKKSIPIVDLLDEALIIAQEVRHVREMNVPTASS